MPEDPAYLKDLRKITRAEPQSMHLEALERELYASGSDRATALMFASFVEIHLERLLLSSMRSNLNSEDRRKVFQNEGPMASFSSKIVTAYALGLIGQKTRRDLDLIRLLRNEFAHSRTPFDFTTPEVGRVCHEFKLVEMPPPMTAYASHVPDQDISNPRTRFIATCHNVSYRLIVKRDGPEAGDYIFPNDDPVP
jgi:hypothetical protein